MRRLKIQVHRGVAENAEWTFPYDPIGRQRLDHKLPPFGNKDMLPFMAVGLQGAHALIPKRGFSFGGLSLNHVGFRACHHASHPEPHGVQDTSCTLRGARRGAWHRQIKKQILCVLGGSGTPG
jgi:hypothetical protein